MKYFSFSKSLAALTAGVLLFSSCEKADDPEPLGDAGQTVVKIMEADYRLVNIELVSTVQVLNMVDIRRDIPNESELNKTMKVIVKDDPGAVSDYNAANGKSLIPIPAAQYLIDPSNPKVGTDYTITMNPGEFAKWLKFSIPNALALDLNKSYAFGFSISSVDAGGKISNSAKKIVVEVGVKNQWDGVYRLKGKFYLHPTYAAFAAYETDKIELHTAGATTLNQFCTIWGEYCQPFTVDAAGALNRFGGLAPQYVLNPVTNAVTVPAAGGPGNTTPMVAAAGYTNTYDPVTKTFYIAHGYTNAAGALRFWADTLTFIRPR
jgi:Domain of unknown function (DUF1735)